MFANVDNVKMVVLVASQWTLPLATTVYVPLDLLEKIV